MADSTIKVGFRLVGSDEASKEIDKARGSVMRLGATLAGSAAALGPMAGDLGGVGKAATVAGNLLGLIPGPLGMIAGAAAGAGLALYAMFKNSEDAATQATRAADEHLRSIQGNLAALAEEHGFDIKLLQTTTELQELQQRGKIILESINTATRALNKHREAGDEAAEKSTHALLQKYHENSREIQLQIRLLLQKKTIDDQISRTRGRYDDQIARAEAEAAVATDKRAKAEKQASVYRLKKIDLQVREDELKAILKGTAVMSDDRTKAEREIYQIGTARLKLQAEMNKGAEKKLGTVKATRAVKQDMLAIAEREWDIDKAMRDFDEGMAAIDAKPAQQIAAAQAELDKVMAAGNPERLARLEMEKAIAEAKAQVVDGTLNEVAAQKLITAATIDGERKIAAAKKDSEIADLDASLARGKAYSDIAKSATEGLAAVGVSEKALAAIKAGILIGDTAMAVVRSIAIGDYASAAVATAAGAAGVIGYGAQIFGGGSGGGGAPSGGTGSTIGAGSSLSSGNAGPSQITVVIQAGAGVIGTEQGIALNVQKALGSLPGTGFENGWAGV